MYIIIIYIYQLVYASHVIVFQSKPLTLCMGEERV